MHRAFIINEVCKLISTGDTQAAVKQLNSQYPAAAAQTSRGTWSKVRLVRVFVRDGFTDRYFGEPLLYPGVLRALSLILPDDFPYHPNWKQSETHPAYWDLYPTIDHIVPVARGGADDESNVVTTSMVRNAAKSNWLLEELQWPLTVAPVKTGWDGLLAWFLSTYENNDVLKLDRSARYWYNAAKVTSGARGEQDAR